jgi:hypothetical protein
MKLKTTYRRHRGVLSVMIVALMLTLAAVLGSGSPATAADPPDLTISLPAGVACDFPLSVEIRGANQVFKEFVDKNGNVVRSLSAGKGSALLFINEDTDATFSLKANGSVSQIAFNPDGSSTQTITGHNVLILFPSDVPAGPSTTLHVGRVVFTVDVNGVFTLQQVSGKTTDICAELSDCSRHAYTRERAVKRASQNVRYTKPPWLLHSNADLKEPALLFWWRSDSYGLIGKSHSSPGQFKTCGQSSPVQVKTFGSTVRRPGGVRSSLII